MERQGRCGISGKGHIGFPDEHAEKTSIKPGFTDGLCYHCGLNHVTALCPLLYMFVGKKADAKQRR